MQQKNRHLCRNDRDFIYRMNQEGKSQQEIAKTIGFSQGTISKELSRNRGKRGYRPKQADEMAARRQADKPSREAVVKGEVLVAVEDLLAIKHTPQMISGALKLGALGAFGLFLEIGAGDFAVRRSPAELH